MDEVQRMAGEIERLHRFFEDWYAGVGDRSIEEFSGALDDAFHIVSPEGDVLNKASIVEVVRNLGDDGVVEIRIKNVRLRSQHASGIRIVTYEEHQRRTSESVGLISTVGLLPADGSPGGFVWLFVHETYLPTQSD